MKRERLRRILSIAILDNLGLTHSLTFPNCKRYITPELLTQYRISRETQITNTDFLIAIQMIRGAMRGKPVSFRTALKGSAIAEWRTEYMLSAPIVDLLKVAD